MNTFKDMSEALKQYAAGLLSEAEIITYVQCDAFQKRALSQILALPSAAASRVRIYDFDEYVETQRLRAEHEEQCGNV